MSDAEIIAKAYEDDRILITIDKDFGARIFRENRPHRGVVLLRLENECAPAKIAAIQRLLDNHSERLAGNFVVVTGSRVRFARSR